MLFTGESPSPFIGVLTADLKDSYQAEIWKGISFQSKKRGVGLLCLPGAPVHSPKITEASANRLYKLAQNIQVDGYIILSSTIFTYMDSVDIKNFFDHQNLPLVSVGLKIPGYPSVSVNGDPGLKSQIRHLITTHNRKRFALLSGPREHHEIVSRTRVFFQTLKEYNIPFDEKLCFHGDFHEESGERCIEYLISLQKPFDALVCLNDRMALGAIKTLQSYGWEIPDEISVIGFDNIDESEFSTPPLTTVQQPLFEMGITAVDSLFDFIHAGIKRNTTLKSKPVLRESCGCPPNLESWTKQRDNIKKGHFSRNKSLISELLSLLENGNRYAFLRRLNLMQQKTITGKKDLNDWYEILSIIQSYLSSHYKGQGIPLPEKQQIMIESAFLLLEQNQSRKHADQRITEQKQASILRDIGSSLAEAFERPLILDRLKQGLKKLGIYHSFLGLLPEVDNIENIEITPILPRPGGRHPFAIHDSGDIPQWILNPLVFQEQLLGFLLLPGELMDPIIHDTLSKQLASTLKGALLLDQVRRHEKSLEKEVKKRTGELLRANEQHLEEMEHRIKLEEEVAEISNRIMTRIGQDLHDDFCQYLAGISMLLSVQVEDINPSPLKDKLTKINALLNESIIRIKQIVRGLIPPGLCEEGLSTALESLVEDVNQTYKGEIILYPDPEGIRLEAEQELAVYRIMQEALSNAIRHSKSSKIELRLGIDQSVRSTGFFFAEIRDWGTGIPLSPSGKGMGLKIMEYRAEKAGGKLFFYENNPGTRVFFRLGQEKK